MQQLNKGKGLECNVILQEFEELARPHPELDFTDLLGFHHKVLQEQGLLPKDDDLIDPVADNEDAPTLVERAHIINTLYGIGAPDTAAELHCSVEVFALLCWSQV